MRWVGHVARIGEVRGYTGFWLGKDHLENPGIGRRIILNGPSGSGV